MVHRAHLPEDQRLLSTAKLRKNDASPSGNRIFQIVFEEMQQRIRSGDWLVGDRLPSITQLAKELQVSTASIREALRSLQSIGLVKIEHGRGVFVTNPHHLTDLPQHLEEGNTALIIALAETRRIIEPELAAMAAERATDAELGEIKQLAEEMEAGAMQNIDFVEPDVQFHHRIAEAARNPILFQIMESMTDLLLESRKLTSLAQGMTSRAVQYHLLIAEALFERNAAQARLLMLAHMNDALGSILAHDGKIYQAEG